MINTVEFMSLRAVKSVLADSSMAIVSVRDSSTLGDLPGFDEFLDVLPLHMLDVCEEHFMVKPGTWVDEPNPDQHLAYCGIPGNFAPAMSHAKALFAFFESLHAYPDPIDVLVHCSAGISRSAAVALWASERYAVPLLDRADVGLQEANPRVLRLLRSLD